MNIKEYRQQHQKLWITIILLVICIKIFSSNRNWAESLYATGLYPYLSRPLRFLFGWIPFSFGDILYFLAGVWLLRVIIRGIRLLFQRRLSLNNIFFKALNLISGILIIYVIFNIFWGINYNRKGISYQVGFDKILYDTSDLKTIQNLLLQKVNESKTALVNSNSNYPTKNELFRRAINCYHDAEKIYPFLRYRNRSVKSSFYGWLGNYWGFTGYYNPFTGEAQVNTEVPPFLQPYIATHEMAHQLGYARENEANFAGYLAAVNSDDTLFHYSAYFDLFIYANREVYFFDSLSSRNALELLVPGVKNDIIELRQFNQEHRSFFEPAITWLYGNYLKMNQQPSGMRSYNDVVGMLIAYYKKYGKI